VEEHLLSNHEALSLSPNTPKKKKKSKKKKKKQLHNSLKDISQKVSHDFCLCTTGQSTGIWPFLPTRKLRSGVFILGSNMSS
jgi:hypothetical protein